MHLTFAFLAFCCADAEIKKIRIKVKIKMRIKSSWWSDGHRLQRHMDSRVWSITLVCGRCCPQGCPSLDTKQGRENDITSSSRQRKPKEKKKQQWVKFVLSVWLGDVTGHPPLVPGTCWEDRLRPKPRRHESWDGTCANVAQGLAGWAAKGSKRSVWSSVG